VRANHQQNGSEGNFETERFCVSDGLLKKSFLVCLLSGLNIGADVGADSRDHLGAKIKNQSIDAELFYFLKDSSYALALGRVINAKTCRLISDNINGDIVGDLSRTLA